MSSLLDNFIRNNFTGGHIFTVLFKWRALKQTLTFCHFVTQVRDLNLFIRKKSPIFDNLKLKLLNVQNDPFDNFGALF